MAADVITALVGLVGALIGAAAGCLGAVRSAARSNRPAWTSAALDAARAEVDAFHAAGLAPDPVVVHLAEGGS